MKKLIALLGMVCWAGVAAAQTPTQLPIRYGANGQPLTPFQTVPYFNWVGPDHSFPHDPLMCAQQIMFTAEHTTLASNVPMNGSMPDPTQLGNFISNPEPNAGGNPILPTADYAGITANYAQIISVVPSTDMLIRWSACRWGIDEDTLRAQMWQESGWFEDTAGDKGNNNSPPPASAGCAAAPTALNPPIYDTNIDWINGTRRRVQQGCYESYGIGQEKVIYLPTVFPLVKDNTAFAVDYRGAATRGCINGDQVPWYTNNGTCTAAAGSGHGNCNPAGPNPSTGLDLYQGCVASHFAGAWWNGSGVCNTGTGAISYWDCLQNLISNKPWNHIP